MDLPLPFKQIETFTWTETSKAVQDLQGGRGTHFTPWLILWHGISDAERNTWGAEYHRRMTLPPTQLWVQLPEIAPPEAAGGDATAKSLTTATYPDEYAPPPIKTFGTGP